MPKIVDSSDSTSIHKFCRKFNIPHAYGNKLICTTEAETDKTISIFTDAIARYAMIYAGEEVEPIIYSEEIPDGI